MVERNSSLRIRNHFVQQRARVELLPLIDVVFLLLVFFIYVMLSMTLHRGIEVDLPTATASAIERNVVVVTISADGGLQVDGIAVAMDDVIPLVKSRRISEEMTILVEGDREADLGVAVSLLDLFRRHQIEKVSFAVDREKSMQ